MRADACVRIAGPLKRVAKSCTQSIVISLALVITFGGMHAGAQTRGIPSIGRSHSEPALSQLQLALARQDLSAVHAAVAKITESIGEMAGRPELKTKYYRSSGTHSVDFSVARDDWLKEVERGLRVLPWLGNPDGDPYPMKSGLRDPAHALDGLARTALLFSDQRDRLSVHVRAGADWLVKLQHPSGVFPFPVGPARNSNDKVGRIVARNIKKYPEMIVNGWIADDRGDGGLQFDNALCGRALISAWKLTDNTRYLDAARKSGDWAITQPLVTNWNYNAFSVGLLAQLARTTNDSRYLNAAIRKAEIGVLPGQLKSGRWFDPHNASAVYHNILLRDLLTLLQALPASHPFRATLLDSVMRGLNQAANETLAKGYTGTWTDNFAQGLQWIGENKLWRDALHVNLNASGKRGAPGPGLAILAVLEGIGK
jgi:hypothetical protein